MKMIFYVALVAGFTFCGWMLYPQMREEMVRSVTERRAEKAKQEDALRKQGEDSVLKNTDGKKGAAALLSSIKNNQTNALDPSAKPVVQPPPNTTTQATPEPPKIPTPVASVDPIDAKYPMPVFKSIAEITNDWTKIPSRAFPRKVKTKVPVTFDVNNSKVVLPENSEARAIAMVGGMLVLMREGDDVNRAQVPLANTDLKEYLTALYEKFKDYKRNQIIAQRDRARALLARANGANPDQMKAAGPKPEQRRDGVIPVMLDHLRTHKLTELKEENITGWGELNYEDYKGVTYWTGTLQCKVETALFGPMPTEVMALIKDGQVVKWVYTGSQEDVQ